MPHNNAIQGHNSAMAQQYTSSP